MPRLESFSFEGSASNYLKGISKLPFLRKCRLSQLSSSLSAADVTELMGRCLHLEELILEVNLPDIPVCWAHTIMCLTFASLFVLSCARQGTQEVDQQAVESAPGLPKLKRFQDRIRRICHSCTVAPALSCSRICQAASYLEVMDELEEHPSLLRIQFVTSGEKRRDLTGTWKWISAQT